MKFRNVKLALLILFTLIDLCLVGVYINVDSGDLPKKDFYKDAKKTLADKGIDVSEEYISFEARTAYVYELSIGGSYYERAAKLIAFDEDPSYSFDVPEGERYGFESGASVVFFDRLGFYYRADDTQRSEEYLALASDGANAGELTAVADGELPDAARELADRLSRLGGDAGDEVTLKAAVEEAYYSPSSELYIIKYRQYAGQVPIATGSITAVISNGDCAAMYGNWLFTDIFYGLEAQICDYVNILFNARRIVSQDETPVINIERIDGVYTVYYSRVAGKVFLIPAENVKYNGENCLINAISGNEYTNSSD